jgi:type I restriction enzyme R subunit
MGMNEADTTYHRIDPVLREKGYTSVDRITLEPVLTPSPVEPAGAKGRRRKERTRAGAARITETDRLPQRLLAQAFAS